MFYFRATLASRVKGFEITRVELESNFRIVKFNVSLLSNSMTSRVVAIKQLISERYGMDKSQKDLRIDRKEVEEVSNIATDWHAVIREFSTKVLEMEERLKLIDILLQKSDWMTLRVEQTVTSGCEESRWYVNFSVGYIFCHWFCLHIYFRQGFDEGK